MAQMFNLHHRHSRLQNCAAWLLLTLFALIPPARAADQKVFTVAVFDFESKDEAVRDLGPKVATLINATLSAEPQIITVERAELEKVLGEQELGLSGTVSTDAAAKVGHLTGAKVLVTGRVFKADKELILVAKIIGTETSRVYGELVKGGAEGSITDLSGALAKKIAATVTEKGETLLAKVQSREDRIARIKESLKSDKLPSVSVKIGERHFGQAVIDPAAETELGLILGGVRLQARGRQIPRESRHRDHRGRFQRLRPAQRQPGLLQSPHRTQSPEAHRRNPVPWTAR